jgi:single-strand DNA-binding protein
MNKVILLGRLTKDVEVKYTSGAQPLAVARYTLAVNRNKATQDGQTADFINCVAFGKTAEFAEKYFQKGQQVAIVGRLQVRSYEDNNHVKKWVTEVITESQYFADDKREQAEKGNTNGYYPVELLDDDELPF